jgi:hypothetical protein
MAATKMTNAVGNRCIRLISPRPALPVCNVRMGGIVPKVLGFLGYVVP